MKSWPSEKPRTLTFDLNQDPKYDTGLVCGGTLEIFIEPVLPSSLLYIFGAGHVALELFKAARNAGFECIVADDREAYANAERFPGAVRWSPTTSTRPSRNSRPPSRHTSSSPRAAIATTCAFCAGPCRLRRATSAWSAPNAKPLPSFASSRAKGSSPELFDRVHSPVGLDIGAVTPEEIAVSIVAELIAVRRRAERALPHMSWFQSGRHTAANESAAPGESLPARAEK